MENNLKENEEINYLELKGLKIIQKKNDFRFGIDSVLLSDFAKNIKKDSKILDLGTGTGILCILLSEKIKFKMAYGIEIQEEVAKMAQRSVELNHLENKIKIIQKNIKELENIFEKNVFDAIITNPPYKEKNSGLKNINENKTISRHEISADLSDFINISFKMLKDKGEFYMIHRPERLVDILFKLRENKMEPKEIRFIHTTIRKEPKMVLIKAIKNGKPFLQVREPLYIYNEKGKYTQEILKIYSKEGK